MDIERLEQRIARLEQNAQTQHADSVRMSERLSTLHRDMEKQNETQRELIKKIGGVDEKMNRIQWIVFGVFITMLAYAMGIVEILKKMIV